MPIVVSALSDFSVPSRYPETAIGTFLVLMA